MRQQVLAVGLALILLLFFSVAAFAEVVEGEATIRDIKDTNILVTKDKRVIRLLGVQTPLFRETMYPDFCGLETLRYVAKTVRGKKVKLEVEKGKLSDAGFLIAYVYLPDGKMLNLELLRKGYGRVIEEKFKNEHEKEFLEVQKEAQDKNLGIWQLNRSEWDGLKFKPSDKGALAPGEKPEREETIHEDF